MAAARLGLYEIRVPHGGGPARTIHSRENVLPTQARGILLTRSIHTAACPSQIQSSQRFARPRRVFRRFFNADSQAIEARAAPGRT